MRFRVQILFCCFELSASEFTPHCSSSSSLINKYLAIDNGGYLCMNNLCMVVVVWLNVS